MAPGFCSKLACGRSSSRQGRFVPILITIAACLGSHFGKSPLRSLGLSIGAGSMAQPGSKGKLRVVTYNIKGFGSGFWPEGKDPSEVAAAYAAIRDTIANLKPDVVCLNEVVRFPIPDPTGTKRVDSLEALAEDLGGMKVHFAHATPGFERFGNAVLLDPNLEFVGQESVHLDGGSVVKTKEGRDKRIVRSVLGVRFQATSGQALRRLAVLATHLDHISSVERQRQVSDICRHSQELSGGFPHLLVGDLNALKRTDYSPEEWAAVEAKHKANGWPPPEGCAALQALEAAGYEDILERSCSHSHGSSLADLPAVKKLTAPAEAPDIRIDYAYCCKALSKFLSIDKDETASESKPCSFGAKVWIVENSSGSDHFPVVIEIPW